MPEINNVDIFILGIFGVLFIVFLMGLYIDIKGTPKKKEIIGW